MPSDHKKKRAQKKKEAAKKGKKPQAKTNVDVAKGAENELDANGEEENKDLSMDAVPSYTDTNELPERLPTSNKNQEEPLTYGANVPVNEEVIEEAITAHHATTTGDNGGNPAYTEYLDKATDD